ncbi:tetratricopeptide repeat-containing sulfotransferase family protein [Phenylobacterium soli]|uniref:Uncharacterized protein n=1 Tax=Phenylobacterium soli TaxID=2170551 RepID=A0A328AIK4_9CAUL|nr:sulfotransferase [Phenylobacterium soli]RAK54449.1 hypothetical protein DJ017_07885 [Phenylobacterium soli]
MSSPPAPGPGPNAAASLAAARGHAQAGQLEPALEAAREAAGLDPRLGEAFAIWGVAAAELGRFGDAVEPLRIAAQRTPPGSIGWANLTSQLARCLSNTGFWAEALECAEAVERAEIPDPLVRQRIGAAFARMNRNDRGLPHLEWARERRPDWPDLLGELGLAYMSEGRLDEAEVVFEQAIALSPAMVQPHATLAQLRRWTPERNHVSRLAALRADPATPPLDRGSLGFALFKELDDLGRTDEAWAVLEDANAACWAKSTVDWSAEGEEALTDALIETFPAAPAAQDLASEGPTPIFILGLPRSGTTLLERMLAAHSQVEALGELPTFPILFRAAAALADRRAITPELVRATAGADWRDIGELYAAAVRPLGQGTPFFIDKLPANSLLVGAIRCALPQARIILLRRAPMDSLFGAYKIRFASWYGWSYRQEDLAAHYLTHERLMAHWAETLGDALIEVSYETLVANPEAEIRRILAACGLAFEPACLEPHKTPGAVRTASITQVREPISAARVGGWRRYEAQLEPLRRALAAAGVEVG